MERNDWMRQEICSWQSAGVIDEGLRDVLLSRYPEKAFVDHSSWGVVVFSALGSLMIGLGVVALFAANWLKMCCEFRAVVSVMPLLVCGILAVVAVSRGWRHRGFWESLGCGWMIALVAAVSLILQTYNIGGEVHTMSLLLAFLSLPIVWYTRSVLSMALWMLYPTVWACCTLRGWSCLPRGLVVLGLLACSLPAFLLFLRREKCSLEEKTGFFFAAIGYAFTLGVGFQILLDFKWHCYSGDVFALCFWIAALIVGLVGWRFRFRYWVGMALTQFAIFAMIPVVDDDPMFLIVPAFLGALAILLLAIRQKSARMLNLGLVLAVGIICGKFLASEMDFTVKGLILLAAGIALIAANIFFYRYRNQGRINHE